MCVFDQAHSTPKWGWGDRGKDRLQKGFTVNISVGYMKNKQIEISQDG